MPLASFIPAFLVALVVRLDSFDARGPFVPTPAGLSQVRAAMVPVPSAFSLGLPILRTIVRGQDVDTTSTLFRSAPDAVRLTEAELLPAVRLMVGQVGARRNAALTFRSRKVLRP
jgi:hypothetical protein